MLANLALVAAIALPASAQWSCGGSQYTPGSTKFTEACYETYQSCVQQFGANASLVNCGDSAGNLSMQQQQSAGSNSQYLWAFEDIIDFCLLDGSTTGTWSDGSDGQWYWMAAEPSCYSSMGNVTTTGPGFCVQNRNDLFLSGCYQPPNPNSGPLKVLRMAQTANGFNSSGRGWNTFGIQALEDPTIVPGWTGMNQSSIMSQCKVLGQSAFQDAGYDICSLDAGWSANQLDEYGRILYNNETFNLPELGSYLQGLGLKLGVYIVPGVPCQAANLTIMGTDILIGDVLNGNYDGLGLCDFDLSRDGAQQWHDSLVELWASWGVQFIKLDYVTPGSISNGANLVCDNSGAVEAYHKAIQNSGKQIRLDLSWKLCRNETWLDFWSVHAESMRTDQDIDNYGTNTLISVPNVQGAIENYRQYIALQAERGVDIGIYPDMDMLAVANAQTLTGVSDAYRTTVMNHWLGAGANLILGGDLNNIDALGMTLLTSSQTIAAADYFAQYPMQPRNPGTGNNLAKQLQAWIAGPDPSGQAYALIANYGPDQGTNFNTSLPGVQEVTVSLLDLGISGQSWNFTDVWNGNSSIILSSYTAYLDEGVSQLLLLQSQR